MAFSQRRGRPRKQQERSDRGTPELQRKRAQSLTVEPLDYCLTRGLITMEQHWCGIHFRWLYTLKYGAPGVRATDPAHLGGCEHANDNPEWRVERESEFMHCVTLLQTAGLYTPLQTFCIYGTLEEDWCRRHALNLYHPRINEGLDLLCDLWAKRN